jgi:hypothetical protein
MPAKSCVINPITGRAVGVPGTTYNKLVKQGAFKKGEKLGKLKARKAAEKRAEKRADKKADKKAGKKTTEENPEEEFKRLDKRVKRLEKELMATKNVEKATKISEELKGLRLRKLRVRRKIKK